MPLLRAFMNEVKRSYAEHPDIPRKMVEYLLGEFDFYKIISVDSRRVTRIQGFNLHGTLNRAASRRRAYINVPIVPLPTRIVSLDYKPSSGNTVELYLDGGWQFSFRIHNAKTEVESSLKFDIQMVGIPATILSIDCHWR